MESKDTINTEKEIEKSNQIKSKNQFINLKSNYILKRLFGIIPSRISLKIKLNVILIYKKD